MPEHPFTLQNVLIKLAKFLANRIVQKNSNEAPFYQYNYL